MPDRSPPLRAVRIAAQCPTCGRPADPGYKPFCRKRCADIDLGRWLKEAYRIATDQAPDEEDPASGGDGPSGQRR